MRSPDLIQVVRRLQKAFCRLNLAAGNLLLRLGGCCGWCHARALGPVAALQWG
ncbi:hypothetical protein EMGBD1_21590 [Anaerolineaceae bacterium]|nr:hypothetical protein EMGBD1_21590 [Anaerolineaceae bacterium]